jgi:hypothetical protein
VSRRRGGSVGLYDLLVDVAPGFEESFSLETPEGVHFATPSAAAGPGYAAV